MTITETPKLFDRITVGPKREIMPATLLDHAFGGDLDGIHVSSLKVASEDRVRIMVPNTTQRKGKIYDRTRDEINDQRYKSRRSKIPFVNYVIGWEATPRRRR